MSSCAAGPETPGEIASRLGIEECPVVLVAMYSHGDGVFSRRDGECMSSVMSPKAAGRLDPTGGSTHDRESDGGSWDRARAAGVA